MAIFIKDLQDQLEPDQYEALKSIKGFETLDPLTPVAGLTENGNYHILYLNDGSKLRFGTGDSLDPEYPECIDCTITKKCDGACEFCYMGCTKDGKHADLTDNDTIFLLNQIRPYTELAINGNDLSHPDLAWLLYFMNNRNVFVNMTLNQKHYSKYWHQVLRWKAINLVRGIGVSYTGQNSPGLLRKLRVGGSAIVIHVIAGIITKEEWEFLSGNNFSILILGYKNIGRGIQYQDEHSEEIEKNMAVLEDLVKKDVMNPKSFRSIAFDGLSIQQLHVKDWLDPEMYQDAFAGEEGAYTFYLDLVDKTYARSSIEEDTMPIEDLSIDSMFENIKVSPLTVH